MNAVKLFAIYDNGVLDKAATRAAFNKHLEIFDMLKGTDKARIACAISIVFTKWRGKAIMKDALVNLSLMELKVNPDSFDDMKKGIIEFLRENTGPKGKMLFGIKHGAGFIRWSDQ